jgi:RNA polymerase sigma-70 factor (ECF subfamily)
VSVDPPSTPPGVPPDDARLRELIARGEIDRATAEALRIYGPELLAWLCATMPTEVDGYDAFSWMSEDLWKSLRRFDGRCSLRTWCYMLARHAAIRVRGRRAEQEVLVSQVPSIAGIVSDVWSTTKHNRAAAADVYTQIRNELDEEDQILLVLRVDKDLAWRDIAQVILGEEAAADELQRKAAALRKQFERVKDRLKVLAAERLANR